MGKHTPGPFVIKTGDGNDRWLQSAETNQMVAQIVYDEEQPQSTEEFEANADLLRTSPRLLTALEAVLDYYVDDSAPYRDEEERKIVREAEEALKQARA